MQPEPVLSKTCRKCKETKPFSEYNKHPYGRYGFASGCKQCLKASEQHRRLYGLRGPLTYEERFWAKVDKTPGFGRDGDCWEWTGALNAVHGYGHFRLGPTTTSAHRAAYRLVKGEITTGLVVMHSCDNRKCVNPDHLSLGTTADNLRDMDNKGRRRPPPARTHCPKGHEYTIENSYCSPSGNKHCRACARVRHKLRADMRLHQLTTAQQALINRFDLTPTT